ncbi:Magnetosome formation protease MamE [Rhodovastum atsumiense]|uniref:PDZ domain-containing protein n=1 Tax=Rhodovastum atsumiense TaxID=504468 RepID=A0A5M6IP06_9PROT|nr:trypsin-like peptidase domain-containing protein [Rhodovastum atsumiense]KAA5610004.1 PDZ domain-containing protein [Rhodovastum atsumiense]CAH2598648.1 Magnetosome formation protease MamE [Rhodovastum atsumiense]
MAPDETDIDIEDNEQTPKDCARGLRKYLFLMAFVVVCTLVGMAWYQLRTPGPPGFAAGRGGPVARPAAGAGAGAGPAPLAGPPAPLAEPGQGRRAEVMARPVAFAGTPGDFATIAAQLRGSIVAIGRAQPDIMAGRVAGVPVDPAPAAKDAVPASPPDGALQFATPTVGAMLDSIGTGMVVRNDGYILTNYHVVRGGNAMVVTVFDETGAVRYPAEVIKLDASVDLALVKVQPQAPLVPVVLGDSDQVRIAEEVIAIGSPFGLDMTVSRGIVSARRKSLVIEGTTHRDLLQTDAAINQGNSGGPLVNRAGEVIGVNTAIYTPTGAFSGVGFAIPSNQARRFLLDELDRLPEAAATAVGVPAALPGPAPRPGVGMAGPPILAGVTPLHRDGRETMDCAICHQIIPRPGAAAQGRPVAGGGVSFARPPASAALNVAMPSLPAAGEPAGAGGGGIRVLGAAILPVTAAMAPQLAQPEGKGVAVTEVTPGTEAADAGLQAGMVIEKVNGRRIRAPRDLWAMVQRCRAGEGLRLSVVQGGTRQELRLPVMSRPGAPLSMPVAGTGPAVAAPAPKVPTEFSWKGLEIETFAPFLPPGAPAGSRLQGAVIAEVVAGSPAQRIGLQAGDIVLEIGGWPTASAAQANQAIQAQTGKVEIPMRMARNNREFFVVMP